MGRLALALMPIDLREGASATRAESAGRHARCGALTAEATRPGSIVRKWWLTPAAEHAARNRGGRHVCPVALNSAWGFFSNGVRSDSDIQNPGGFMCHKVGLAPMPYNLVTDRAQCRRTEVYCALKNGDQRKWGAPAVPKEGRLRRTAKA